MAIEEEKIQKTMKILTNWNPLGRKADLIKDLDNYRTEAIDILFHMDTKLISSDPLIIVSDILNQAFDLNLSREECSDAASEIVKMVSSK